MKTISLDTEATGLDIHHGVQPYFVTVCHEDMTQQYWEWDVDPLTRKVNIDWDDVATIREVIDSADEIATQNGKFDAVLLERSGVVERWPWEKMQCTLTAGHLLNTAESHSLDDMVIRYLGPDYDIRGFEEDLKEACHQARRMCRSKFPDWLIAKEGMPGNPSVKGGKEDKKSRGTNIESPWKADAWLLRELAKKLGYPRDHPWWTLLRNYGNADSAVTLPIWLKQRDLIKQSGLWKIYCEAIKAPLLAANMEKYGASLNRDVLYGMRTEYKVNAYEHSHACISIASDYTVEYCTKCGRLTGNPEDAYDKRCLCEAKAKPVEGPYKLDLPSGNANDNLKSFCFRVLGLEHVKNPKNKTDAPCLDAKNAIPHYLDTLSPDSNGYKFIENLSDRASLTTAVSYLDSYERYWIQSKEDEKWCRIHSHTNPTGTRHLRWAFSNPNAANISKRESECRWCDGEGCRRCKMTGKSKTSLRKCFGPLPGREWWSMDAKNIELRVPAYECGEAELIDLFERSNEPPYYGSEHLLNFSTVYPDVWDEQLTVGVWDVGEKSDPKWGKRITIETVGPYCKKKFADTYYQWCKNGGFAIGYGSIDRDDGMGTADRTFQRPGAHKMLKARFAKKEQLNQRQINYANEYGYVETIPDAEIDPERGYPIVCERNKWNRIKPTVPLNYHVSGTAMWWMRRAMAKTQAALDEWNAKLPKPEYFITLQVHDQLVFDFPKRADPRVNPKMSNLSRVRHLKSLMESCGKGIGIPTPCDLEYHPENWSNGISF